MAVSLLEGEFVCIQIPLVLSINLDTRYRHRSGRLMLSCRATVAFYGWPLISANTSHRDETSVSLCVRVPAQVCVCMCVCVSITVLALSQSAVFPTLWLYITKGGLLLKLMTIIN